MPTIDHLRDVSLRPAELGEAEQVRSIDTRAFPEQSEDLERAPAGELEAGVAAGDVYLMELGQQPVGYIHLDRSDQRSVYIAGCGVVPGLQNRGLGKALFELAQPMLAPYEDGGLPIYTVTSPHNTRMLHLLFNMHFAGRWVLLDHFGPGRHRIGCQLLCRTSRLRESPNTRRFRRSDISELSRLVGSGWVISGPCDGKIGQFFEVSVSTGDDFPYCPRPGARLLP